MDKDEEEGEGRVTSVFYQNANERGCVKCPYYHHHRYRRRSPRTRRSRTRRESARDARACVCPRSVAIRLSRSAFNYPSTVRGEQEISRLRSLSLQPTRDDPRAFFYPIFREIADIEHPPDRFQETRGRGGRSAGDKLPREAEEQLAPPPDVVRAAHRKPYR